MIKETLICAGMLISVAAFGAEPAQVVKLWPTGAPGETGQIGPEHALPQKPGQKEVIRLADVSVPTISLYPPPAGQAMGQRW